MDDQRTAPVTTETSCAIQVILTDEEWSLIERLDTARQRGGRRREVVMRQVVNGVMQTCQHRLPVAIYPQGPAAKEYVHDYLTRWNYDGTIEMIHHVLYVQCREAMGGERVLLPA